MSGQHITNAAAFFPHRIKAAASLYGVGIITDKEDSPHLHLDKIKGELYYAFAETDRSVPPNIPGDLAKLLAKTNVKHEIKTFPGTEHGFAFPERAVYIDPRRRGDLGQDVRDVGPQFEGLDLPVAPHPFLSPQAGRGSAPVSIPLSRLREREGPIAERWEGEGRAP